MPRTRTDLDRDTKAGEILAVAERRLRDSGYSALSMAAIARELGLAQNAVYWYFPSKDHLFVAAFERMLRDMVERKPPRRGGLERQVTWFVDQLAEIEHVRVAMHEQARNSQVVAEFAARLDATWRTMLTNVLADRVSDSQRPLAVAALLATIQGLLSQRVTAAERARVLSFALERLIALPR
jgi:TetR/AcrR family transcriptional regulator, cholesterol catabolism regulator